VSDSGDSAFDPLWVPAVIDGGAEIFAGGRPLGNQLSLYDQYFSGWGVLPGDTRIGSAVNGMRQCMEPLYRGSADRGAASIKQFSTIIKTGFDYKVGHTVYSQLQARINKSGHIAHYPLGVDPVTLGYGRLYGDGKVTGLDMVRDPLVRNVTKYVSREDSAGQAIKQGAMEPVNAVLMRPCVRTPFGGLHGAELGSLEYGTLDSFQTACSYLMTSAEYLAKADAKFVGPIMMELCGPRVNSLLEYTGQVAARVCVADHNPAGYAPMIIPCVNGVEIQMREDDTLTQNHRRDARFRSALQYYDTGTAGVVLHSVFSTAVEGPGNPDDALRHASMWQLEHNPNTTNVSVSSAAMLSFLMMGVRPPTPVDYSNMHTLAMSGVTFNVAASCLGAAVSESIALTTGAMEMATASVTMHTDVVKNIAGSYMSVYKTSSPHITTLLSGVGTSMFDEYRYWRVGNFANRDPLYVKNGVEWPVGHAYATVYVPDLKTRASEVYHTFCEDVAPYALYKKLTPLRRFRPTHASTGGDRFKMDRGGVVDLIHHEDDEICRQYTNHSLSSVFHANKAYHIPYGMSLNDYPCGIYTPVEGTGLYAGTRQPDPLGLTRLEDSYASVPLYRSTAVLSAAIQDGMDVDLTTIYAPRWGPVLAADPAQLEFYEGMRNAQRYVFSPDPDITLDMESIVRGCYGVSSPDTLLRKLLAVNSRPFMPGLNMAGMRSSPVTRLLRFNYTYDLVVAGDISDDTTAVSWPTVSNGTITPQRLSVKLYSPSHAVSGVDYALYSQTPVITTRPVLRPYINRLVPYLSRFSLRGPEWPMDSYVSPAINPTEYAYFSENVDPLRRNGLHVLPTRSEADLENLSSSLRYNPNMLENLLMRREPPTIVQPDSYIKFGVDPMMSQSLLS